MSIQELKNKIDDSIQQKKYLEQEKENIIHWLEIHNIAEVDIEIYHDLPIEDAVWKYFENIGSYWHLASKHYPKRTIFWAILWGVVVNLGFSVFSVIFMIILAPFLIFVPLYIYTNIIVGRVKNAIFYLYEVKHAILENDNHIKDLLIQLLVLYIHEKKSISTNDLGDYIKTIIHKKYSKYILNQLLQHINAYNTNIQVFEKDNMVLYVSNNAINEVMNNSIEYIQNKQIVDIEVVLNEVKNTFPIIYEYIGLKKITNQLNIEIQNKCGNYIKKFILPNTYLSLYATQDINIHSKYHYLSNIIWLDVMALIQKEQFIGANHVSDCIKVLYYLSHEFSSVFEKLNKEVLDNLGKHKDIKVITLPYTNNVIYKSTIVNKEQQENNIYHDIVNILLPSVVAHISKKGLIDSNQIIDYFMEFLPKKHIKNCLTYLENIDGIHKIVLPMTRKVVYHSTTKIENDISERMYLSIFSNEIVEFLYQECLININHILQYLHSFLPNEMVSEKWLESIINQQVKQGKINKITLPHSHITLYQSTDINKHQLQKKSVNKDIINDLKTSILLFIQQEDIDDFNNLYDNVFPYIPKNEFNNILDDLAQSGKLDKIRNQLQKESISSDTVCDLRASILSFIQQENMADINSLYDNGFSHIPKNELKEILEDLTKSGQLNKILLQKNIILYKYKSYSSDTVCDLRASILSFIQQENMADINSLYDNGFSHIPKNELKEILEDLTKSGQLNKILLQKNILYKYKS